MALTQGRMTKRRDGVLFNDPVAASTTLHTGALACLNSEGNLVPGSESATLKARGVVVEGVANTGSAGAQRCETRAGCFNFKNSASTDLITRADIGGVAYIVDDETVAKTSATNTRSPAGRIADVNEDGVWVDIGAQSITVTVTGGT